MTEGRSALDHGAQLYATHCGRCHGPAVQGGGLVPDLRYMTEQTHQLFDVIVLGGLYADKGMVSFNEVLSESDSHLIHQYVIAEIQAHHAMAADPEWWNALKLWFYEKLIRFSAG